MCAAPMTTETTPAAAVGPRTGALLHHPSRRRRRSRAMPYLLISGGMMFVWATPVVVAIDIWQWMVDFEFGVANWLLTNIHVGNFVHHNWFESPLQGFTVIAGLVVWGALPFLTITLYAGLAQVPGEVVEAAECDGAGPWQLFWQVTLPILRPLYLILVSLS